MTEPTPTAPRERIYWPYMVVAMAVISIGMNVALLVAAGPTPPEVVRDAADPTERSTASINDDATPKRQADDVEEPKATMQ